MPGALLIGTADGLFVRGGRSAERVRFEGQAVTALAVAGRCAWALLDGREIWRRSRPRGAWSRIAEVEGPRAHCLAPVPGGLLVGTAEAHLLSLRGPDLARVAPFDSAPGRREWFTPWGGAPDTRSIAVAPGGAIYANVHVGGVLRSRDRGASWQPTLEIGSDVHQVLAHPSDRRVVLAASAVGLGVSRDGGETWTFETEGFHALYQRAVAIAGGIVLVSCSRSERGERAAVYRRALRGGGPFEKCARGLPEWFPTNVNTHCIAAAGAVAAIGVVDGSVFLSRDRGRSWRREREGLPKVTCVAFAA